MTLYCFNQSNGGSWTPSSGAASLMNLSALYDSVFQSTHPTLSLFNGSNQNPAINLSLHHFTNSQHQQSKKLLTSSTPNHSSFSIEAILGLNHHKRSNKLSIDIKSDSDIDLIKSNKRKFCYDDEEDGLEREKSEMRATGGVPVSPDSTAKEHNITKHHHHTTKTKPIFNDVAFFSPHKKSPNDSDSEKQKKSSKLPNKVDLKQLNQQARSNPISSSKAKRIRTIFTPEQLERLENEFERQQYMVGPERLYLASTLNLTEAQVKVWFQNRRIKWRKQHLEMQQQRFAKLRQSTDDILSGMTTDEDGEQDMLGDHSSPRMFSNTEMGIISDSPTSFSALGHINE